MSYQVISADDRARTDIPWLQSRHSFSFGDNYDPGNTHHGVLMVSNDDIVAPQQGFDTHPHRDMEIVTWVLSGSLVHQDSMGHSGVIYPGLAQRMSAGTGITHSERNDTWNDAGAARLRTGTEPVHFVQMWVLPDEPGIEPGYQQLEVDDALASGALVPIASGIAGHDSAIRIASSSAALHVSRMSAGQSITLPDLPYGHVFVARGAVRMDGAGELAAGDAARITGGGGEQVTAVTDAEILVWEMHRTLGQ